MGLKNKWSQRDEAELACLLDRKKAFEAEARAPLNKIVVDMGLSLAPSQSLGPQPPYPSRIVDLLVARADELRDALAPFDSGVRCGSGGR
jgi:hypothetical protein